MPSIGCLISKSAKNNISRADIEDMRPAFYECYKV